jgi:hypothetical protein
MNTVKKGWVILLVALVAIALSGCATLFNDSDPAVSFMSSPSAAQIYVNGTYVGDTPFAIELSTDKEYTVEFRKDGYKTRTYFLTNEVGVVWIVLDILGGFIPIIVDAVTGEWYELSEENVSVVLEQ